MDAGKLLLAYISEIAPKSGDYMHISIGIYLVEWQKSIIALYAASLNLKNAGVMIYVRCAVGKMTKFKKKTTTIKAAQTK